MDLKEIKEMINLMNENDLVEFEMEKDGVRFRLKKRTSEVYEQIHAVDRPISLTPQQGAVVEEKTEPQSAIKLAEIKSPIVGTFYRALSPDAAPFVDAGDELKLGQVVCIIEAMKLMNEIKSEIKGKIVKILVENGEPVEFGQVLFLVEPI